MEKRILYIFTRTPLHVGAGASVGAIDQPIQRERHTGFPVIPASSLKGTFADAWNDTLLDNNGKRSRVRKSGEEWEHSDASWLFGSDDANHSFAGAVQFSEARLLAFPVRSAKGSFAWITSPLVLKRAARDGLMPESEIPDFPQGNDADGKAIFDISGPLAFGDEIVLEEYVFKQAGSDKNPGGSMAKLFPKEDPVCANAASRIVIVSDGMMTFLTRIACEVSQHVRISDETGTAEGGALFNQENVPSESLFYSTVHFLGERSLNGKRQARIPAEASSAFGEKIKTTSVFQFGGDASTGLGYCTVTFDGGVHAKP